VSWPDLSLCQSIDRHIAASGLSPDEIRSAKQQRDLATMMDGLCFDPLLYITGQKIGSQHIHGTWSGLLTHYLEERNDAGTFAFAPSPGPDETHINQFMFIPIIVLHALGTFAR
jgi:hypothetical protein